MSKKKKKKIERISSTKPKRNEKKEDDCQEFEIRRLQLNRETDNKMS